MMPDPIHLSKADVTELEEQYVLAAIRSGWCAPLGPDVDAFEAEVAELVGVEHALALSSGSAALHLAMLEVGAGPGRVVVMPTMTFAATANAVAYTGATPVFVDALRSDANIDPERLVEAVDTLRAEGADVCAVVTVDLFGRACDYAAIEPALEARGIALVEDAAEALGASRGGRRAGTFGRAAALSFNGNKIMTTSGGGMLLSDDGDLVAHARKLSTQAREPVPWYEHVEIGYNYRLSNLLAAFGRAQLSRLPAMIERRREIRARYARAFEETGVVTLLGGPDGEDNCWLTGITLADEAIPNGVTPVLAALNAEGIEARHVWRPMHLQPVFSGARTFLNGVSDDLFRSGLLLPSGSALSDSDVDRVVAALLGQVARAGTR
jgi:dTDP-4-amino-4,6-dideoxygalactose transaminase